jgi:hypothetical protein
MMRTSFISPAIIIVLLSLNLGATEVSGRLSITPIIGLESVQKFQPTAHMKTRAIYGARAIYRFPISALEAEYTHAQDTNNDSTTNTSYKDSEDKLRLGLRGSFMIATFLNSYIRGGAQYRKNEQTRTLSNAVTTTSSSSKVQPYIGTGIDIRVMKFFSINADILATYTPSSNPNLRDYELQPSIGLSLRF